MFCRGFLLNHRQNLIGIFISRYQLDRGSFNEDGKFVFKVLPVNMCVVVQANHVLFVLTVGINLPQMNTPAYIRCSNK